MKNKLQGRLFIILIVISILTGCGNKEESITENKESVQEVTEETTFEEVIEEVTIENEEESITENEEEIITKSKEELIFEEEFREAYINLQGYWVNDEISYYFDSFLQGNEVVFFYTRTDEPDTWYRYEINSTELIGDFNVNERYINERFSVSIYDNKDNKEEVEFNILTDFIETEKHIDIVSNDNTINMTKLSEAPFTFLESFDYLNFIDLNVDEDGNISLIPVEIKDITLNTTTTKNDKPAVYFCTDSSDGYYSFITNGYTFEYDGYYVEEGFRDKYDFYGVTIYPWKYEMVRNPYLNVGNEIFEAIPLSEDILAGFIYQILEDKVLTYQGIEGRYLDHYIYQRENGFKPYEHAIITLQGNAANEWITFNFREESLYDKSYSEEFRGMAVQNNNKNVVVKSYNLSGVEKAEDYIVVYDDEKETNAICIMFKWEGLTCQVMMESDNPENMYEEAANNAKSYIEAFSVSNGEQNINEHLKEILDFNGYTFSEEVCFTEIKRGENSACGFDYVSADSLKYVLNDSYYEFEPRVPADDVKQVYETEFADDFVIDSYINVSTRECKYLCVYEPDIVNRYLVVSLEQVGFFDGETALSEVEEESTEYLLYILRKSLVKK